MDFGGVKVSREVLVSLWGGIGFLRVHCADWLWYVGLGMQVPVGLR